VESYNAAMLPLVQVRAAEGKHIVLVDQNAGFPNSELADGVHPNDAGYRRMAGVWYAAISNLLR
jgi:lysophospholipase L1-like esterase